VPSETASRGNAGFIEGERKAAGGSGLIDRRGLHEEIQQALDERLREALVPGVALGGPAFVLRASNEMELSGRLKDRMRRSFDWAQKSLVGEKRAWRSRVRDLQCGLQAGACVVAGTPTWLIEDESQY
jgi:hypothetical protein